MIYHVMDTSGSYADRPFNSFSDLQQAVDRAVRVLRPRRKEFDVIAVQGTSGMSIGFPVTLELQRRGWKGMIVVVRKPDESHHSYGQTITGGDVRGKRCLFLDDFVSEGETRTRVRLAIEKEGGQVVAQYTSRDDAMTTL